MGDDGRIIREKNDESENFKEVLYLVLYSSGLPRGLGVS